MTHGAAKLDRNMNGVQEALLGLLIHRLALEGAVEIDDMQPFESLALEKKRLHRRISVEHRCALHLALTKTHASAVFQIDSGKQDHRFHTQKLAISARPSFWLFSGLN